MIISLNLSSLECVINKKWLQKNAGDKNNFSSSHFSGLKALLFIMLGWYVVFGWGDAEVSCMSDIIHPPSLHLQASQEAHAHPHAKPLKYTPWTVMPFMQCAQRLPASPPPWPFSVPKHKKMNKSKLTLFDYLWVPPSYIPTGGENCCVLEVSV